MGDNDRLSGLSQLFASRKSRVTGSREPGSESTIDVVVRPREVPQKKKKMGDNDRLSGLSELFASRKSRVTGSRVTSRDPDSESSIDVVVRPQEVPGYQTGIEKQEPV